MARPGKACEVMTWPSMARSHPERRSFLISAVTESLQAILSLYSAAAPNMGQIRAGNYCKILDFSDMGQNGPENSKNKSNHNLPNMFMLWQYVGIGFETNLSKQGRGILADLENVILMFREFRK